MIWIAALAFAAICVLLYIYWSTIFAISPFAFLRRLARRYDKSHATGFAIVMNPRVTAAELADIATDSNQYLRRLAAEHFRTDEATLRSLARDESRVVRTSLIENPNTPGDVSALIALEMMVDKR